MFLGVDGGGTKTAVCLLTDRGEVAALASAPGTYYLEGGICAVSAALRQGVEEVCAQAGVRAAEVDHAFFGLPAYGEVAGDVTALDALPREILGHDRYACGNDMVCAWAGSLGAGDGVNVICGTGSMAYGQRDGLEARCGGWGELFGDEGSGHWIAREGLGAFTQMSDGRAPRGLLHERLRTHLSLVDDLEVIDVVLNRWRGQRAKVASLCPVVVGAAEDGDEACTDIVDRASAHLVRLVEATRIRLGWPAQETMPLSFSGGVYAAPSVRERFTEDLVHSTGALDLRAPLYPPVVGAALYAARLARTPLSEDALDRLRDL